MKEEKCITMTLRGRNYGEERRARILWGGLYGEVQPIRKTNGNEKDLSKLKERNDIKWLHNKVILYGKNGRIINGN